ncbi:MAG: glycosyltransferase family 9 protein [Flavobacteriales bacterium]|nr:glycosyltransferase family 9 protein [Flavobacteriales bacterium]
MLILRFSSIGDIVLTSPVLRCVKQQLKDVELHFATKAAFADLVRFNPHVDKVHELRDDLGALIAQLKAERFDAVIDLHHNLRTARVKRALGVKAHSFPKLNIEKWLMVHFKMNRLPRQHIVDRYMGTVASLGVKNDGQGLDLFIPPDREVELGTLPAAHQAGYTALAIGAAHATKRLPPHKLIELAALIEGPIVLIGGKEDQAVARSIVSATGGRVFDATGRYDILGSASLIRQARRVIAHDSGAMHIACAFAKTSAGSLAPTSAGSPDEGGDPAGMIPQGPLRETLRRSEVMEVMSIWGNTVPAFGMGPYIPTHPERARIAQVNVGCRPCSKIGYEHCPQGHFRCMEDQDLRAIATFADA